MFDRLEPATATRISQLGFNSVLRNVAEEYGELNLRGACLTLDFPYANHFSTSRRGLALSPTCLIRGRWFPRKWDVAVT